MEISKLLNELDHKRAFEHYLGEYFKNGNPQPKTNISNPLIIRKQNTPSFNYYQNEKGEWRFKDFATDDKGDIVELVKRLFHLEFTQAVNKLFEDFNLTPVNQSFEMNTSPWNRTALAYWREYGITEDVLDKYHVYNVENYRFTSKSGKQIAIDSDEPIFTYRINSNCFKVYQPFKPSFKFSWLGNKPKDYMFGFDQLPVNTKRIYITGGEKDVLSLASHGYFAVCFNSETAVPENEQIALLKARCKELVVLYDNDATGKKQAEQIARKHGLSTLSIPDELLDEGEKDVSDLFRKGFDLQEFEGNLKTFKQEVVLTSDELLIYNKLEATRKRLNQRMQEDIIMPRPLLSLNGVGVIYPKTINIIQGKAGVHKSRLAEIMCSSLIDKDFFSNKHLGFKREPSSDPFLLYVDTERNLDNQFPYALQQIQVKAGFSKGEFIKRFDFLSLLTIERSQRFKALDIFLKQKRSQIKGMLVVVLDVITDCIRDFNRSEDSMQLIDMLNTAINTHDVTFITLIHENPGSGDKARGHLGTELMNKSSTVMQIGFEKDGNNKPTDVIALNFLKTRASKKPETTHIMFSEEKKTLVLADPEVVQAVSTGRRKKASVEKVIEYLEENFENKYLGKDLLKEVAERFACSEKIARERIVEIVDEALVIKEREQKISYHLKSKKEGKSIVYVMEKVFA